MAEPLFPCGTTKDGLRAAMHIAVRHFAGEERSHFRHSPSNPHAAATLHAAMAQRLPSLWSAECEGPQRNGTITAGELREALSLCPCVSPPARPCTAPGLNGLTYESYSGGAPLLTAPVNQAFGAHEDFRLSPPCWWA